MEYKLFKLKELLRIKNGKDYKMLKEGCIPVFGTGGIVKYVDDYLYDGESILLPRKGTLDNIQYVEGKFWTIDTMYWSIVDKNKVSCKYLYLYLSLLNTKKKNTGSTLPSMTFETYYSLNILLPDYNTQIIIADFIFMIIDKIENNNKINNELESLAKTIYDYWFLQFDFPNEEGKPYKSSGGAMVWNEELKMEIPKEWSVTKLGNLADIVTGKENANHAVPNGKYPFFTCSNSISKCNDFKFDGKAILIAGNGDFNIKYYDGKFNAYQRTYVVTPKDDMMIGLLYFCVLKNTIRFANASVGSIEKFITKGDIENIPIIIPNNKNGFELFNNCLNLIQNFNKENDELIELRDFLLPLLMNGQVGFKDN